MAMGWDFVGALVQMERHHNAATISPTSNLGECVDSHSTAKNCDTNWGHRIAKQRRSWQKLGSSRKPFLGAPRNVPLPNVASVEIYRKRKLKAAQLGVTGSLGGVRGRAGGQSLCFCNLQNCMSSSSCAGLYPAAPLLGLHSPATNGRARGIRPQLLVCQSGCTSLPGGIVKRPWWT
ncbi:uncharacterized protein [Physcomitrium patens]|uniref:uncharacterized protein isoform X2 n=1 Tax=Physcomitrium patens TaxID=3218 RepID=UPI000D1693CF|nr:uncharacterized protein LOC112284386 isoform X2 [Physcomitrium patens]|eukprot:XP_024379906.1 uncharacterized protein LOC112284386 isoform X2 [Physcomitrella patens]